MKRIGPKTLLALSLATLLMAGCAGSKGGVSDGGDVGGGDGGGADAKTVSAKELDEAAKEAAQLEEENHELRREIFDAKNKLGIATDTAE
jgi:hypothetical protein